MIYHIIAFVAGFIIDLIIGDPYSLPHPIRLIGKLIAAFDKKLNKTEYSDKKKLANGRLTVIMMCLIVMLAVTTILVLGYIVSPVLGIIIESVMTWQILATKCLKDESMKVYKALESDSLENARKAVSMIVGRDTKTLDEKGITRAAVETVAENTSDGIIAPMLYTAIGGPVLGFLYKTINTMDSMIAYKNGRYMQFGRMAAITDDIANYVPARISAGLMIASCALLGREYDIGNAARIFKRDRYNHASPNSAQTEAVMAGALNVRLAGPASYFGEILDKKYIGDNNREIENEDIKRANKMLYVTAVMAEAVCLLLLIAVCAAIYFIFPECLLNVTELF